jgi:hypothetical protein
MHPTFVKPVHIQLPNKGRYIGMLEILPGDVSLETSLGSKNSRQNLRKITRWRHDKTLVCIGPGYKMLNSCILEHAR